MVAAARKKPYLRTPQQYRSSCLCALINGKMLRCDLIEIYFYFIHALALDAD